MIILFENFSVDFNADKISTVAWKPVNFSSLSPFPSCSAQLADFEYSGVLYEGVAVTCPKAFSQIIHETRK